MPPKSPPESAGDGAIDAEEASEVAVYLAKQAAAERDALNEAARDKSQATGSLRQLWNAVVEEVGGGAWPPNPLFEDAWPESIKPYARLCDEASIRFTTNPQSCLPDLIDTIIFPKSRIADFREWMESELDSSINLEVVTKSLNHLPIRSCQGLFSCLIHLLHMYRWGQAPVIQEALSATKISFPSKLIIPLEFLGNKFGLQHQAGCAFTILICSGAGGRSSPRFGFSQSTSWNEPRSTEASFYNCARSMEDCLAPIYKHLCDLQDLLEAKCVHKEQLSENIEGIVRAYRRASKVFNQYHRAFKEKEEGIVDPAYWLHYVQSPHSWSLDELHGSAGTQFPIYRALDILCGDIGKGWAWDSASGSFENDSIPYLLKTFAREVYRADLRGRMMARIGPNEADQLLSTIVKAQMAFRSSHASKARRYFSKDNPFAKPVNSFGVVHKDEQEKQLPLGEIFFPKLNERVKQSRARHRRMICPVGRGPAVAYEHYSGVKKTRDNPLRYMLLAASGTIGLLSWILWHGWQEMFLVKWNQYES